MRLQTSVKAKATVWSLEAKVIAPATLAIGLILTLPNAKVGTYYLGNVILRCFLTCNEDPDLCKLGKGDCVIIGKVIAPATPDVGLILTLPNAKVGNCYLGCI